MLYAQTADNDCGVIENITDVLNILHRESSSPNAPIQMQYTNRVKPTVLTVYTYFIASDDDSLLFSETSAAFFVNVASKHALHANAHTRPFAMLAGKISSTSSRWLVEFLP